MSFLLSLFDGGALTQIVLALAGIATAVGGLFAVKRTGYNQGKAEASAAQTKDALDAVQARNDVKADVAADDDDAVRRRLRERWTAPGSR